MPIKINQSETREIMRSQIRLNPLNPKRHTDELVKLQKKNLQKVGFLGGVVWNDATGNLVDGHRRLLALDIINGYNGDPSTDYPVKVEVTSLDEKTEKEQVTYMAVGSTRYELDMIAAYIKDIDYKDLGLRDGELRDILAISEKEASALLSDLDGEFLAKPTDEDDNEYAGESGDGEESYNEAEEEDADDDSHDSPQEGNASPAHIQPPTSCEENDAAVSDSPSPEIQPENADRIAELRKVKAEAKEAARQKMRDQTACITLSFSTEEALFNFCDLLGISCDSYFAKGEDVLRLIQ